MKYEEQLQKYGEWWHGDFTWKEVNDLSIGYNQVFIVEKIKDAILQAAKFPNCHERDGVVIEALPKLEKVAYWLKFFAVQKRIDVVDVGGSLGSVYFAIKRFLEGFDLHWYVVEQSIFVEYGKKYFENQNLMFFEDINECLDKSRVVLLSSVLPYLEFPYQMIDFVCQKFQHIILERNAYVRGGDRLTIQVVPKFIFPTVLPCWFFNEEKVINYFLERQFRLIDSFDGIGGDFSAQYIPNSISKGHVFTKVCKML